MRKLFLIGLKDVKLAFRDRAALILMLLAPFLLTLGLGGIQRPVGMAQDFTTEQHEISLLLLADHGQDGALAAVDFLEFEKLLDILAAKHDTADERIVVELIAGELQPLRRLEIGGTVLATEDIVAVGLAAGGPRLREQLHLQLRPLRQIHRQARDLRL